jgi:hypothetical protein
VLVLKRLADEHAMAMPCDRPAPIGSLPTQRRSTREQRPGVAARRAAIHRRGRREFRRRMRPLEVVNAAVGIESTLRLEVVGGWFNFAFEREV